MGTEAGYARASAARASVVAAPWPPSRFVFNGLMAESSSARSIISSSVRRQWRSASHRCRVLVGISRCRDPYARWTHRSCCSASDCARAVIAAMNGGSEPSARSTELRPRRGARSGSVGIAAGIAPLSRVSSEGRKQHPRRVLATSGVPARALDPAVLPRCRRHSARCAVRAARRCADPRRSRAFAETLATSRVSRRSFPCRSSPRLPGNRSPRLLLSPPFLSSLCINVYPHFGLLTFPGWTSPSLGYFLASV